MVPRYADVTLISPWTEPVHVSPSYQLIRDEISRYSRVLVARKLERFMTRHSKRWAEYGDVVRYQDQFPFCPGLLSIAAVLEQHGFSVRCVSLDVERELALERGEGEDWLERAVARICAQTSVAVGVTAVTPEYPRALRVLELVKQCEPQLRTMIGGTHVSYLDEETARESAVDVVVRGEGEQTAVELLGRWIRGESIDDVAGTTLACGATVRRNPDRALIDLRELPLPAYHLLDEATRARVHLTPTYSRGCPYSCSYCVEGSFFRRKVRHKDPKRFVDELEMLIEIGNWRFIHIADSTFGLDRDAIGGLCDELERRRLDAVFSVNVRPNVFHYLGDELVRRLVSLDFVEFYVGMESADEALLDSLRRKSRHDELVDTLHRLRELDVPFVKLYLIVGAPGDTHESITATLAAVRELQAQGLAYYATGKFFVPTPGTDPYNDPESHGFEFRSREWGHFERYNFPPVVEHQTLTPFEIEQYLGLLQAMQLAHFRRVVGVDDEEDRRVRDWVERTYHKKIYL